MAVIPAPLGLARNRPGKPAIARSCTSHDWRDLFGSPTEAASRAVPIQTCDKVCPNSVRWRDATSDT
jgi:hypothetical protein